MPKKSFTSNMQLLYAKKRLAKNETILKYGKNGHYAKAIAFAKSSLWVKK